MLLFCLMKVIELIKIIIEMVKDVTNWIVDLVRDKKDDDDDPNGEVMTIS